MRPSSPRATLAALALSAALALGGAACTKASSKAGTDQPSSPATNVSPESSAKVSDANTVPPGVSGQGSGGGQGQGQAKP